MEKDNIEKLKELEKLAKSFFIDYDGYNEIQLSLIDAKNRLNDILDKQVLERANILRCMDVIDQQILAIGNYEVKERENNQNV